MDLTRIPPPPLHLDLSQLMTQEKFSDMVLVTKEGTRIPAHRVILVRCQYFCAMFCGGMKEATFFCLPKLKK